MTPDAADKIRDLIRMALVLGLAALLGLAGLGLILAALWIALARAWGPIWTSFALGSGMILVALTLVLLRPKAPAPPRADMPSLSEAGLLFGVVALRALLQRLQSPKG